ncbi:MAG TPA: tetratricopeptide repeat protein [Bacteroidota bacterium]|nr:tetratricopeptide repeat protein [Bacteroidota bacterium]
MPSDDQNSQNDSARRQLLEEIRRRAEEAELKRLEEEDRNRTRADAAERMKTQGPAPFPISPAETPAASNKAAIEQKLLVVRERLQSAIERGKSEKAAELFAELSRLAPDDPALGELKQRIHAMQEEKAAERARTRPMTSPRRESAPTKAEADQRRKKISDMLEAANTCYQQEQYERAMGYVGEVLKLEPDHEQGKALLAQIDKARVLEEQIRLEEEERRAKESKPRRRVEPEQPVASGRPTDFWGVSQSHKFESDYDLIPEEKGPVGPPPLPLSVRIAKRLARIEVPVKPLLTIGAILAFGAAVWYIVDTVRNSVSPARYSVLLLPPATGGDTSMTYVADGFAGDLMAEVSRMADMRVINPATAYAFGASVAPPGQIARALGANYVLSWTMDRPQTSYHLQLAFTDTLTGKSLWSREYRVSMRELPGLRPEIVRALALAMGVKMVANDGSPMTRIATNNEAAYDLYLRGRFLLQPGGHFAPEDALALFAQALRLDPEFGDAHAASAWAHMLSYETSSDMQQAHLAQAVSSVQRALSNGLRTSELFRAWGLAEQYRGDYDKAIERFEQSAAVCPSDAETERRLAVAYAAKDRMDAALKASQRSVADDPGNIAAHTLLGEVEQFKAMREFDNRDAYKAALLAYEQGMRLARDKSEYGSGLYVDVLAYLEQTDRAMDILLDRTARLRESYIDFYKLGRVQQSAGRPIAEWQATFVRAREILTAHLETQPDDAMAQAYLALVLTRLGAFKDAAAAIGRAQAAAPNDVEVLYLASRMFALHKDKAQALQFLSKAMARRYILSSILDMDLYSLHADPDFMAAIKR